MRLHQRTILLILSIVSLSGLYAQQNLPSTSVNVFKNGTYFVVKEGKINAPNSKAELLVPGSPLLGTYWFTTTKDYKINKAEFVTDTVKRTRIAQNLNELLQANAGKKVRISYVKGDKETGSFSGVLSSVGKQQDMVKIKAPNNQTLYIAASKITEFIVEENAQEKFEADSLARVAKLYFNKALNAAPLKLSYVNTGINWIPSYSIKILNDKQLQLELKALVENYAEDISGAELTLTVGAPNFRFGRNTDPLAINAISGLQNYSADSRMQTYMFQNAAPVAARGVAIDADFDGAYAEYSQFDATGQKSNDLYFYQLGKVDIPKNAKVSFPIFSSNINYEDLYEVNIGDHVAFASNRQIFNQNEQKFDVYHALRLTNNYNTPLTTAPVFIQDENLNPLAQDQLNYTPVGGKVKIQLAKSPDIVIGNTEEETDRAERAKRVNNNFYSKVTIRGSIKIENLQNKAIQLNTTKGINGLITKASDGGKIQKPGKYAGINSNTSAEWDLKIGAGETKTINYEYEVFVFP
jgi:hypothetical protein